MGRERGCTFTKCFDRSSWPGKDRRLVLRWPKGRRGALSQRGAKVRERRPGSKRRTIKVLFKKFQEGKDFAPGLSFLQLAGSRVFPPKMGTLAYGLSLRLIASDWVPTSPDADHFWICSAYLLWLLVVGKKAVKGRQSFPEAFCYLFH